MNTKTEKTQVEKSTKKTNGAKSGKVSETAKSVKSEEKASDAKTTKPETVEQAKKEISSILGANVNTRLNRLETLQILADKFNAVNKSYDELTHFMAGNDQTNASMKFASASNYSFTLRNPVIIDKILGFVEREFSDIVDKAEKEILNFTI